MQVMETSAEHSLLQLITDGSLEPFVESNDNSIWFSIYRFITRACGKHDDSDYGRMHWKYMLTTLFKHHQNMTRLLQLCKKIKPYKHPLHTITVPCTNVEGLQCLMDMLGHKATNGYRKAFQNAVLCSKAMHTMAAVQVKQSDAQKTEQAFLQAKMALDVAEKEAAAKHAAALQLMHSQKERGYCYVASNKSMPGIVKIGFTEISPSARVKQLFQTGVPEPFDLIAYISCESPRCMEKVLHEHFRSSRVSTNREFFRVSGETVVAFMSHISRVQGNVHLHAVSRESQGIVEAEVHFLMLLFIEHTSC